MRVSHQKDKSLRHVNRALGEGGAFLMIKKPLYKRHLKVFEEEDGLSETEHEHSSSALWPETAVSCRVIH